MRDTAQVRRAARWRRKTALASGVVMIATLLQGVTAPVTAAAQADDGRGRPALPKAERPVAGSAITKVRPRTIERGPRTPRTEPKAQWPEAGSGWVTLPGASAVAKGTKAL